MSAIRELYQEIILDHNKNPRNYRRIDHPTRSVEGFNPLCGDHYTVYVKLDGGMIADLSFDGAGCAISKASASVMTSVLKGKTVEQAEEIFQDFHRLVRGETAGVDNRERLGKLAAFAGVSEFPARVKCASLAWHTLHEALRVQDGKAAPVSTE